MSYVNAPATRMLASQCACCAKALVDSDSVESGIGPVCRDLHGYGEAQGPADWTAARARLLGSDVTEEEIAAWNGDAHKAANILIHRVAVEQKGGNVEKYVSAIEALGYTKVAARIDRRLHPKRRGDAPADGEDDAPKGPAIHVTVEGAMLAVKSPYSAEAVAAIRMVPGRKWEGTRNLIPVAQRAALVYALRMGYPGMEASFPEGVIALAPIAPGEQPPWQTKPVVRVTSDAHGIAVDAPYSPKATEAFRAIVGRKWDPYLKVNRFPALAKFEIRTAIERCYPDAVIQWPAGLFPADPEASMLEATFGIEIDPAFVRGVA
jgi:hypothetical protein